MKKIKEKEEEQPQNANLPQMVPFETGQMGVRDLVSRLEDLVTYALECENKPIRDDVSFTDVYKKLLEIRKAIDVLTKEQQDFIASVTGAIGTEAEEGLPISQRDKQLLDKIRSLQEVCESAKDRIYTTLQQNPDAEREIKEKIRDTTGSAKKKIARRKGKFRAMGGSGGWLPA